MGDPGVEPARTARNRDLRRCARLGGDRAVVTGGHVRIAAAREDSTVIVRVADDGIGIEPELLPACSRGSCRDPLHGAAPPPVWGSASPWCNGCSSPMAGPSRSAAPVRARDRGHDPGRRSRGHARPRPVLRVTSAPRSRRVLIVEDNIDAADLLGALVESSGHETKVVYDTEQSLEVAGAFELDVAILDLGLPRMDELGARLHERLASVRLIALTGSARIDRRRAKYRGGSRPPGQAGECGHVARPARTP